MGDEKAKDTRGALDERSARSRMLDEGASAPAAPELESERTRDTLHLLRRLAGKPAREVLARISDGDMLRLYPLCVGRVRDLAFLLDPDRVFERALTEVAVAIEIEPETCAAESGLLEKIDVAIQSVLEWSRR